MSLKLKVGAPQPFTYLAHRPPPLPLSKPHPVEAFTMEHGLANLIEAVRSVQLLKIDGFCATAGMSNSDYITSRWNVDGHELDNWVALKLTLLSEPRGNKLRSNLCCRLLDPSRNLDPHGETSVSHDFERGGESCPYFIRLARRHEVPSGYLVNDSLTVQCTLTVLKDLPDVVHVPANREVPLPLPSSDMHRHFGELLQGQRGADVTFVLESGERLPAHKTILAVAARSPVFMAEFFGHMNERRSQSVRIQDMQAAVFKAMLHFIYTDMVPELDVEPEAAEATMAQHLLAAADRYGLDRLKLICEGKLAGGIDVDTAATTLALAEQHNCSLLKAKCVEFIARSPETLDAVLTTDGYKHLAESCPLVLAELLRAARGRRN
ncbi:unnamed protein product [Urochloa decumbens]|uniref:BTB domain-containing protein n=1 Tax=Urochloa decumbens TaxID=240449 RepID=A0ABC9E8U1_9POAL